MTNLIKWIQSYLEKSFPNRAKTLPPDVIEDSNERTTVSTKSDLIPPNKLNTDLTNKDTHTNPNTK